MCCSGSISAPELYHALDGLYASQVSHVCTIIRELSLRALHIVQFSRRRHSYDARIRENHTSGDHDHFAAKVGQLSIRIEGFRHYGELKMDPRRL